MTSQAEINTRLRNAIRIARAAAGPGESVEIEIEGVKLRYLPAATDSTLAATLPHRAAEEGRLDAVDQRLKAKALTREAARRP